MVKALSANLYLKDYETGEEGFALGAALVLGKDEVIAIPDICGHCPKSKV